MWYSLEEGRNEPGWEFTIKRDMLRRRHRVRVRRDAGRNPPYGFE
jgi:hypothetical protein